MKRFFYVAICAATSFAIISCGNTNTTETTLQQAEANAIDNAISDSIAKAKADSIAKIEAMEKAKADSIAKAKTDSLAKLNNPHPDLKLFDLRGPVKSCTYSSENYRIIEGVFNFANDGALLSITRNERYSKTHKDKNNVVSHLTGKKYDDDYSEYINFKVTFIKDSIGRIAKLIRWNDAFGDWSEIYAYDTDGKLKSITTHGLVEGSEIITFTYLKSDKYGNWTKRKFNGRYTQAPGTWGGTETRTITYYE